MTPDLTRLLSVGQIAAALQRTRMSVHRRIRQLKIEPVVTLEVGGARYDPDVTQQIKKVMRRPNHNKRGFAGGI